MLLAAPSSCTRPIRVHEMRKRPVVREFAYRPRDLVCTLCDRRIFWIWYWHIPSWYRNAHSYGPYRNDVHCDDCHNESLKNDGECHWCK